MISQHDHPKLRDLAVEAGAAGFLSKEELTGLTGKASVKAGRSADIPVRSNVVR